MPPPEVGELAVEVLKNTLPGGFKDRPECTNSSTSLTPSGTTVSSSELNTGPVLRYSDLLYLLLIGSKDSYDAFAAESTFTDLLMVLWGESPETNIF